MIQLRPYQQQAIAHMRAHFAADIYRLILCIATGGGKTVVFSYLAKAILDKKATARVAILTHRTELLTQAGGTLAKFGISWSSIDPKSKQNHHARCYVGKVLTFINRVKKYPHLLDLDVVIIDEAHRGEFKALLPLLKPTTRVIGVTATPISSSKKDPLKNYYQEIVVPVSISDLIEQGYLMPAETYAAKTDLSALRIDNKGEYTVESQMETFAKREVYDGVVNKYLELARGKKAACYNVNIEHSVEVCKRFLEAGITAEHVDGTTPDALRDAIFERLRSGETKVLCNVDVATAGLDVPSLEVCIVNCATSSVTKWLQMAGRSARPCPEIGKQKHIIIDMGNNWKHLGLWEDERDWVEIFHNPAKKKKKKNEAPSPVKSCPECDAIVPISARLCPHCEYVWPPAERAPNIVEEVEFGLVSNLRPKDWKNLRIEDLIKVQMVKEYKVGWILNQLRERANGDAEKYEKMIRELAAVKPYKPGWVKHEMENFHNLQTAKLQQLNQSYQQLMA